MKWGLLFFLLHSLFWVVAVNGETFGLTVNSGTVLSLYSVLEFWWVLPALLVVVPVSGMLGLRPLFLLDLLGQYQLVGLVLIGSLCYGGLGYCVGVTRLPVEEDD